MCIRDRYDQVGIVLRNSLETSTDKSTDGTSYAAYFQPYNGELFRKTDEYGKTYELIGQQKYKKTPVWISLDKLGDTLTMKYSQNGSEWIEVGTATADDLNDEYYFGIFAASNEEYKISEFTLSGFTFDRTPSLTVGMTAEYSWAAEAIDSLARLGIVNGEIDAAGNVGYYCLLYTSRCV